MNSEDQYRSRLRSAVHSAQAPPELHSSVKRRLHEERRRVPFVRAGFALAASILLAVGLNRAWQTDYLRLTPGARESYIAEVSAQLTPVMRVGFVDHLHCTIFGQNFPKNFDLRAMLSELGPSNSQLYPILKNHLPPGYAVIEGHKCEASGRTYLHLVAKKGNSFVSLLFTRKGSGEAFERDLHAAASEAGFPIYTQDAQRFNITGFSPSDFLVFLVSDRPQHTNTSVLSAMLPELVKASATIEL